MVISQEIERSHVNIVNTSCCGVWRMDIVEGGCMELLFKLDKYFEFYNKPYTIWRDKYGYYHLSSDIYKCDSNTMEWLIKSACHDLKIE